MSGGLKSPAEAARQPVGSQDVIDSEERLRLLVEGVKDYAIYFLDVNGRVASWNGGAERIKGFSAAEVIGQHYSLFYTAEDRRAGKPEKALQAAAEYGRCEEEGWRVRKDGSPFWASASLIALRSPAGHLRGYAKITRDFSERRAAEETARRLEVEIAARQAAEQAEERIRESEERYRQQSEQLSIILEGVADGITAHDASGKLLYANDAGARACGYSSVQEFLAAPPGDVLARFRLFDESGERFPAEKLPGRRALAGEENPVALVRVLDSDGRDWWSLIRARAVRDRTGKPYLAVNILRDVTEQRRQQFANDFLVQATAALSFSLDYASTLGRVASLVVPKLADWCAVDLLEDGKVVPVAVAHVDPARAEVAREMRRRYPIDANDPRGPANVLRTGVAELHADITDQMLVNSAHDAEHLRIMRRLNPRSVMIVPLLARGQVLGVLSLVAAESDRRFSAVDKTLAEELARRAGAAVDNARLYREAMRSIQLRDEFLSVAGHELKTPLAAVLLQVNGLLRVLRGKTPPSAERILERLEKAARNGARLGKLIDELLDISRITSGRLKLDPEAMDLAAMAEEIALRFAEESTRSGSRIILWTSGPVNGRWDRMRIDQVFTNLLSNAIKYGASQPIQLTVERRADKAVIEVRDNGIGIDRENQARIFGRFERAVSDRHFGGLGLGLWITRQIVEAHGGQIRVDSQPGRGATFTVELPG